MTALRRKLENLKAILKGIGSAALAFSGGCDSSFLTYVSRDVLRDRLLCVTMVGPFFPRAEKQAAGRIARDLGLRHVFLKETLPENIKNNPRRRCYFCKKNLFTILKAYAKEKGFPAVIDATNADDAGDFRPGMAALRELNVRSPLLEAGFSKKDIRLLSRRMGLSWWDKPSQACLASRFPYGEEFSEKKLRMVENAEEFIRGQGIRQVRVRYHDTVARIETEKNELARLLMKSAAICAALRAAGFHYVCVDLEGYRTGAMNETLAWKKKK